MPSKLTVVQSQQVARPTADESKHDIEAPPSRLVVDKSANAGNDNTRDRGFKKVTPGDVKWHKDFKTAIEKSKLSGKPVMLFQLLGQLDDEFT